MGRDRRRAFAAASDLRDHTAAVPERWIGRPVRSVPDEREVEPARAPDDDLTVGLQEHREGLVVAAEVRRDPSGCAEANVGAAVRVEAHHPEVGRRELAGRLSGPQRPRDDDLPVGLHEHGRRVGDRVGERDLDRPLVAEGSVERAVGIVPRERVLERVEPERVESRDTPSGRADGDE